MKHLKRDKVRNYGISVAMATYNGGRFLAEQLDSILIQLTEKDEIVISDDDSSDETVDIIKSYQEKYSIIRLIEGPGKGVKQNFDNAIKACRGKYIFLSDQDDVWADNKVDTVLHYFESDGEITCIAHDCSVVDASCENVLMESFFSYRNAKSGILNNIYKNRYLGCCLAFSKDMVRYISPIPNDIEMHDQWIGILSDKHGKSLFIKEKLISYRRHGSNVTDMHHYPLLKMISNRLILICRLNGR